MRAFLLALVLVTMTSSRPSCLKLDVILIGDMSGSVLGYEKFVHKAFTSFVSKFDLDEDNLKIGAFIFNDGPILISHLTSNKQRLIMDLNIVGTMSATSDTYLTSVLLAAFNEFVVNGRKDYRKIIILVCDGDIDKTDIADAIKTVGLLRSVGVNIFGVLIDNVYSKPDMMRKISDRYFETNYEELVGTMEKMDICL